MKRTMLIIRGALQTNGKRLGKLFLPKIRSVADFFTETEWIYHFYIRRGGEHSSRSSSPDILQ
jgi:hypothetical protein